MKLKPVGGSEDAGYPSMGTYHGNRRRFLKKVLTAAGAFVAAQVTAGCLGKTGGRTAGSVKQVHPPGVKACPDPPDDPTARPGGVPRHPSKPDGSAQSSCDGSSPVKPDEPAKHRGKIAAPHPPDEPAKLRGRIAAPHPPDERPRLSGSVAAPSPPDEPVKLRGKIAAPCPPDEPVKRIGRIRSPAPKPPEPEKE